MSGWTVQLDPEAIAPDRVMLDLNSGAIQIGTTNGGGGQAIDWGQADITAYETQQGQWGNGVADRVYPNRIVTIQMILGGSNDEDDQETARTQLSQKVALIQRKGGQLMRQRAGGPAMYADIVKAQLTIPDVYGEDGDVEPDVQLVLECKPDWYGDEITLDQIHSTGYCAHVLTQGGQPAVIEGDYPARCRIVVEDTSGQIQQGLIWGLRSEHYDASASAALVYPAASLVLGSGMSTTTLAGSQEPTVVEGTAASVADLMVQLELAAPTPLTHLGSYRVLARAYSSAAGAEFALHWQPSIVANSYVVNAAASTPVSGFSVIDLGVVRLDAPPVGAAQWSGFINTSIPTGSATVALDYLALVPVDETSGQAMGFPTIVDSDQTEVRTEGTWWGNAGVYARALDERGDLARLPASGLEGNPVELFVKPSRSDLETLADSGVDSFAVQVIYRPCWLSRP